jgi:hypothetical protein
MNFTTTKEKLYDVNGNELADDFAEEYDRRLNLPLPIIITKINHALENAVNRLQENKSYSFRDISFEIGVLNNFNGFSRSELTNTRIPHIYFPYLKTLIRFVTPIDSKIRVLSVEHAGKLLYKYSSYSETMSTTGGSYAEYLNDYLDFYTEEELTFMVEELKDNIFRHIEDIFEKSIGELSAGLIEL